MKLCIALFLVVFNAQAVTTEELGSWYFDLDWRAQNVEVDHNETSNTAGFESADYSSTFKRHNFQFKLQKEVMSHWPFSVSVFPVVGVSLISGSAESKGDIDYEESLLGSFYGGGLALNINIFTDSLKLQPFISATSLKHNDEYFFRWENTEDNQRSREIKTILEYDSVVYTLGIRFYNLKNMICTLAVSAHEYELGESEATASMGEVEYDLTSNATIQRGRTSVNIGIGFIL